MDAAVRDMPMRGRTVCAEKQRGLFQMGSEIRDHATEFLDDEEALALESSLWWETGRRDIISSHLEALCKPGMASKIVDIGCGSGSNFKVLSRFGTVIGIDRSPALVKKARARGTAEHVYEADVFDMPGFDDVDVFTLLDVLEHMEDDSGFMRKLSAMSNNHHVLVSVPACPFLYGEQDRILHHQRRYSRKTIEDILLRNNYRIITTEYRMFVFLPALIAMRVTENVMALFGRKKATPSLGAVPGWLNRILSSVLRKENELARRVKYPIGLWLFVSAQRKP